MEIPFNPLTAEDIERMFPKDRIERYARWRAFFVERFPEWAGMFTCYKRGTIPPWDRPEEEWASIAKEMDANYLRIEQMLKERATAVPPNGC